jgi:hypothetical protein
MKKSCQHIGLKALVWIVLTIVVALGPAGGPVHAQTLGEYFLAALPVSLGGLERYIGPLLPVESLGSTFRSETGFAIVGAYPRYAMLRGRIGGELDLADSMPIDQYPFRHDFYTNLRIWRLALKATYTDFDALSEQRNWGKFDFSGVTVGCDVDLVCQPWFNAGLGVEYHFNQPRLHSTLYEYPDNTVNPAPFLMDIEGERPITAGAYARYVPPEILGFPVHGEAYLKMPVHGSKLTSVGGSLVFRPQIYRFDLGARLNFEKCWLSFEQEYITSVAAVNDTWKLDTEWEFYGIQWLIYF